MVLLQLLFIQSLTRTHAHQTAAECVFGYGLLYLFRVFERQRGSPKFLVRWSWNCFCSLPFRSDSLTRTNQVHALTAVSISTALEVFATRLLLPRSVPVRRLIAITPTPPPLTAMHSQGCAPGLYGALFSLLPLFWADVPPAARFTLLGLPLTDKAFTYAVAAQLCVSRGWASVAACACGLAAGLLVGASGMDDAAGSNTHHSAIAQAAIAVVAAPWRLLARALSAWGMFADGSAAGEGTTTERQRGQRPAAGRAAGDGAAAATGDHDGGGDDRHLRRRHGAEGGAREAASGQPSAEALEMLCSMGFDAGAAHTALMAGGGDVSVAAELLLSGSLD